MGHISIFLLFCYFFFFEEANDVSQMSLSLLFLLVIIFAEDGRSQGPVLTEMHPLDNLTTIIEHAANVLRIDGAGEVRIAMFAIFRGR